MAKHPTSSRVHREDHGPDDAFVSTIKRTYTWGRQNSRTVTIAAAILLALGALALWFTSQQRQMESQAVARFGQVRQTVASGTPELAIRDLQSYLDRFGSTEASAQARLLLAGIYLSQEQPEDALEALGDLPEDLEAPFGLAAARLEATAHEDLGQTDQAVAVYQRIARQARFPYQRREALADAARVRLQSGQPDRAASLYEEVVETLDEGEPQRSYFQMWLAEAEAQAREGAGTTPTVPDTTPAAGAVESG